MVWMELNPFFDLPLVGWKVEGSCGFRAMLNSQPSAAIREYFPQSFCVGKRRLSYLRMCRKVSGRSFARCWMKAEAVGTSSGRK